MNKSHAPSPAKTKAPPAHAADDAVDLAAESVAGEEDPGASLDESQTRAPPRGEANSAATETTPQRGDASVENVSDRGGGSVESASGEERGSAPRRADPV